MAAARMGRIIDISIFACSHGVADEKPMTAWPSVFWLFINILLFYMRLLTVLSWFLWLARNVARADAICQVEWQHEQE